MSYMDQYERMLRSCEKLKNENRDQEDFKDDLFHFFMDAWHLKDWIQYDDELADSIKADICSQVHSNEYLLICADLANGAKHLKLKRPKKEAELKSGHFTVSIHETFTVNDGSEKKEDGGEGMTLVTIGQSYEVHYSYNKRVDSRELSENVINAWNEILNSKGLLSGASFDPNV